MADPINAAVGNLVETEIDFAGSVGSRLPLRIERTYNSLNNTVGAFGNHWSSNLDPKASLNVAGDTLTVALSNGQIIVFNLSAGNWIAASTLPVTLVANSGGYLLTTYDSHQYQFNSAGQLTSLSNAQGEQQLFTYTNHKLVSVTDNVGNVLTLTYNSLGFVDTIVVAGQTLHYSYNTTATDPGFNNLLSVSYPAASGTGNVTRQYLFENTQFPWALTGLIDETGNRVSTWGYNAQGLANSNNRAGSENFTIDYTHIADSGDPYSLVTNAKNYSWKYHLATGSDGMVRVLRIEGLGSANCAAASNYTSYDSGHAITVTDGNGNVTLRHYAANGQVDQETQGYRWTSTPTGNVNDLIETPTMRKQVIAQWDSTNTWPTQIIYSGKILNGAWLQYRQEDLVYNAQNRLQSKTLTDLRSLTDPYTTYGQTRGWSYSYTYSDAANTKIKTLTIQGPGGSNDRSISTYDTLGRLTQVERKVTATFSLITSYSQFNAAGLPQRIIDPNGVPTQLSYDARNRLHQVVRNVGAVDAQTTTFDYYENGVLKRITLGDGSWLNYTYGDGVHLSRIDDNAGNYVLLTPGVLDSQWTQRRVFDSSGTLQRTQNRVFDDLGRVLQLLDATNTTIKNSYTYDTAGNLQSSLVGSNASTAIVRSYDALNRLKQLDTPDGNHSQYQYDALGNLALVTDPRGVVTQYIYDGLGNLMKVQSPDSGTSKFWYDVSGNMIKKVDARNIESDYTYDALSRLTGISYPASTGNDVAIGYDDNTAGRFGLGRLYYTYNSGGYTVFGYDAYGNIAIKNTLGTIGWFTGGGYKYDAANRLSRIVYKSGRIVTYTRNALGQIIQVQLQEDVNAPLQTIVSNIAYEPFGPIKSFTHGNGVTTTISRDADARISRITATSTPLLDFIYSYDAADNISSIIDQVGAQTRSKTFTYDAMNRVITGSGTNNTITWNYQYDANGNRTQAGIGPYQLSQTYETTSNRETAFAGNVVTADAAGNITADAVRSAQYNPSNQMGQSTVYSATTTYQYNGLGQRIAKQGSVGTYYEYMPDGKYLEIFTANAGNTLNTYSTGTDYIWLDDLPVAQVQTVYGTNNAITSRTLLYIHANHLNTPLAMTDSTQKIVWRWSSEAFGSTAPNTDPDADGIQNTLDLRFPGQIYDAESSLFYNNARYYDPLTSRYTQSDPIGLGGGLNTFAYVDGNPITGSDPLGLANISLGLRGGILAGGVGGTGSVTVGVDTNGKICMQVTTCARGGGGASANCGISVSAGTGNFSPGSSGSGGFFVGGGLGPFAGVSSNTGPNGTSLTGVFGAGGGASGGGQICMTQTSCL